MATKIDLLSNSSFEDKLDLLIAEIRNSSPADGYSPTITTTRNGSQVDVTVTDKNGSHTFTIYDGRAGSGSGDMLEATYNTENPGAGIVDMAANAQKLDNHNASYFVAKSDFDRAMADIGDTITVSKNSITTALGYTPISPSEKGAADGIATLDSTGKIPTTQIPNVVTETTISDWGFTKNTGNYSKPAAGIPASDLEVGVIPTTLPASDVSAWAKATDKPTYTASEVGAIADTVTHLSGDIAMTEKGSPDGVATLGSDGKVPSSQLPSYVDDVIEFADKSSFPASGESGKIYVDIEKNNTYRWSGTTYVEIGSSLALGETSSTAYAGDKGKALAERVGDLETNKLATSLKGANNGLAELDATGKIPVSQIPESLNDVVEGYISSDSTVFYSDVAKENAVSALTGRFYLDVTTNKIYRYNGSAYSVISTPETQFYYTAVDETLNIGSIMVFTLNQ